MDAQQVWEHIRWDAVDIFSAEGLLERLKEGRPLRVKLGADPSRPDLHLGHSVVLRKLKLLQDAGHEIVFVIGDFTGMIGDPTGRSKTRVPLTQEETRRNGQTYFEQVTKILDPVKTRIEYNSTWLGALNMADALHLAGTYTLARILERDDFANRMAARQAIGLHELFYPLLQGYDSVALQADVEVGGTDQTFNLLVGRELQRDWGQRPQEVITFPLLPGLDGSEKMSKSQGNTIGLDEPADAMFEKCMRVPDPLLGLYARLTTDLSEEEFQSAVQRDVRDAHLIYAREIVRLYHGGDAVEPAEARYHAVAAGSTPEHMAEVALPEAELPLATVVCRAGLAPSTSEARRLIAGGGIRVDGQPMTDPQTAITGEAVVSRGKNRFVRVRLGAGSAV